METIRGKKPLELNINDWMDRLAGYDRIILDLGTGDGRYARTLAEQHLDWFIIGVDACRENLRQHTRAKLPNLIFVIASAQGLPHELDGRISQVTINFPWGSLLQSLLIGDPKLLRGLDAISVAAASLDIRLNSGALAEVGWSLEAGTKEIYDHLLRAGWRLRTPVAMNAGALKEFPSTWAKRLAFGRDPHAMMLSGQK